MKKKCKKERREKCMRKSQNKKKENKTTIQLKND